MQLVEVVEPPVGKDGRNQTEDADRAKPCVNLLRYLVTLGCVCSDLEENSLVVSEDASETKTGEKKKQSAPSLPPSISLDIPSSISLDIPPAISLWQVQVHSVQFYIKRKGKSGMIAPHFIQSIYPEMIKLGTNCYLLLVKYIREEGRTLNINSLASF